MSAAARRLRVDYGTVAVIRALDATGVPYILLKGPSIARWLYDADEARAYSDSDVLVPPEQFDKAVAALAGAGFRPEVDESKMPAWWRDHAVTAVREGDAATVDVHRTLPGALAPEATVWAALSKDTDTLLVAGTEVTVLAEPGRLLHLALATAQTAGSFRYRGALVRGLERCGEEAWRAAASLAYTVDGVAAMQRGLCFVPAGVELARRLALTAAPDIDVELRAIEAPEALTLARLLGAQKLSSRLAIIRYKLAPPATFMRKWSPLARRGRLGLLAAYLWRPVWVLSRLPGAAQSLKQARKAARSR